MWGGRMQNGMGKKELYSNISCSHSVVCACVLWLYLKWQIPFQSQQREKGAPALRLLACGCASACAELGWFPTDELFCTAALGGRAGVGCRNSDAPGPFLSHPSCTVAWRKTGQWFELWRCIKRLGGCVRLCGFFFFF